MKNYLTVTEAALRLKLTRQAVLYAIKAEKLNAERAGRQWVIQKMRGGITQWLFVR